MSVPVHASAGDPTPAKDGQTPPRQCVRPVLASRVAMLLKHENDTRQGGDAEALHDMRVASRRLREALEVFAFCFPVKSYDKLARRARLVTRALGELRNADVAIAYFETLRSQSDNVLVKVALEDVLRRLGREQREARRGLQQRLNQARLDRLPNDLGDACTRAESTPLRYQRGARRSITLARKVLLQRLRELFAAQGAVGGEQDEKNLHRVRITVKKLRYAVETLDYAVGTALVAHLGLLRQWQDVLGALHDRDVLAVRVRRRLQKIQQQLPGSLLETGMQAVLDQMVRERHAAYDEYLMLAGELDQKQWRKYFVPPPASATLTGRQERREGMEEKADSNGRKRFAQ